MKVFTLSALFGVALSQLEDLPALDQNVIIDNIGVLSSAIYGQFAYVKEQMSWSDANAYCFNTYGTTLATLKNDMDAEAVLAMKNFFQGDDTSHVWIGLTDTDGEGSWEWASGYQCEGACDELKWWNAGEPNAFGPNEDCASIMKGAAASDDMLNDLTCDNPGAAHFICDVTDTFTRKVINDQFVYVQSQMSWNEANQYCADTYGTTLATIKNDIDAEAMLAMKEFYAGDSTHVWIGLTDQNKEGIWVWASGYQCAGPCDELEWWNTDEPNSFGSNEDCGHILKGATNPYRMLNDLTCNNAEVGHFICDVDAICEVEGLGEMGGEIVVPLGLGDLALYALILSNLFVLVCLTVRCFQGHMPAMYGKVAMYDSGRK